MKFYILGTFLKVCKYSIYLGKPAGPGFIFPKCRNIIRDTRLNKMNLGQKPTFHLLEVTYKILLYRGTVQEVHESVQSLTQHEILCYCFVLFSKFELVASTQISVSNYMLTNLLCLFSWKIHVLMC